MATGSDDVADLGFVREFDADISELFAEELSAAAESAEQAAPPSEDEKLLMEALMQGVELAEVCSLESIFGRAGTLRQLSSLSTAARSRLNAHSMQARWRRNSRTWSPPRLTTTSARTRT
eukprot:SAG11_NODE_8738_length_981_cov_0.874150_2_plen_120_part_00